jgi:hypothetical protein
MLILRLVARLWIPVVVALVLVMTGYVVSNLRGGAFASDEHPPYGADLDADGSSATPKEVVYEVFGPAGTVADISYFDADATPQEVAGAALPWSMTFTPASAGSIGSIVAQGDSGSIGCRILVDGEMRAEKITIQPSAFTYCQVTGA